jgi:hypothetical protein
MAVFSPPMGPVFDLSSLDLLDNRLKIDKELVRRGRRVGRVAAIWYIAGSIMLHRIVDRPWNDGSERMSVVMK